MLNQILPSLLRASLPIKFWEDAARHAIASINLSPTRVNEAKVPPFSLWSNKVPSYKRLCAFGCKAFRLITGPARKHKLEKRAAECRHLYTLPDGDGWMVWDVSLKCAVKSHDVIFHEDQFPGLCEVSKTNMNGWVEWSHSTSTPITCDTPFRPINLDERCLSASIHNPKRPLRIPLPEPSDEEIKLLNQPPTPEPAGPAPQDVNSPSTPTPPTPPAEPPSPSPEPVDIPSQPVLWRGT